MKLAFDPDAPLPKDVVKGTKKKLTERMFLSDLMGATILQSLKTGLTGFGRMDTPTTITKDWRNDRLELLLKKQVVICSAGPRLDLEEVSIC